LFSKHVQRIDDDNAEEKSKKRLDRRRKNPNIIQDMKKNHLSEKSRPRPRDLIVGKNMSKKDRF